MNNRNNFMMQRGMLDLRGYEVVRVQFFNFTAARSVTISKKGIRFSSECIRCLDDTEYVEALVHPTRKVLAVRACPSENRQAMRWAVFRNNTGYARGISGAAFIGTLYELFELSPECRYRFRGRGTSANGEKIMEFDLAEPEIMIPEKIVYPSNWDKSFGTDYYCYRGSFTCTKGDSGISTQSSYNTEPDICPTPLETLDIGINNLISAMKKPEADNGTGSGNGL